MAKRRPAGSGLSEDEDQTTCRVIASAREAIQLAFESWIASLPPLLAMPGAIQPSA
jgi:hypothetical protein